MVFWHLCEQVLSLWCSLGSFWWWEKKIILIYRFWNILYISWPQPSKEELLSNKGTILSQIKNFLWPYTHYSPCCNIPHSDHTLSFKQMLFPIYLFFSCFPTLLFLTVLAQICLIFTHFSWRKQVETDTLRQPNEEVTFFSQNCLMDFEHLKFLKVLLNYLGEVHVGTAALLARKVKQDIYISIWNSKIPLYLSFFNIYQVQFTHYSITNCL